MSIWSAMILGAIIQDVVLLICMLLLARDHLPRPQKSKFDAARWYRGRSRIEDRTVTKSAVHNKPRGAKIYSARIVRRGDRFVLDAEREQSVSIKRTPKDQKHD